MQWTVKPLLINNWISWAPVRTIFFIRAFHSANDDDKREKYEEKKCCLQSMYDICACNRSDSRQNALQWKFSFYLQRVLRQRKWNLMYLKTEKFRTWAHLKKQLSPQPKYNGIIYCLLIIQFVWQWWCFHSFAHLSPWSLADRLESEHTFARAN